MTDLSPTRRQAPTLHVHPAQDTTRAVVLVLHGGKAVSTEPSQDRHLSVARLVPFARQIHQHSAAYGVATWRVRYRYRGWNGHEASPVQDARWALDEVRREHGDIPVVLLGHSMGGRTALRVADDPAVRSVVALAPWLNDGDPVLPARGRRIVIAHAPRDRWTSPVASAHWAEQAAVLAERMVYIRVRRAGHFMLRRASVWKNLATSFVLDGLALDLQDERLLTGPAAHGRAASVCQRAQAGETSLAI